MADVHPVRAIFRRAAADYKAPLLESADFSVLLATGDGNADLTAAVLSEPTTRLWVGGYSWSDFAWGPGEWGDGDESELETLAEIVAAVQRGDGALFFRSRDGELELTGARAGTHSFNLPFDEEKALRRTLRPWALPPG
ncbi:hypothetical protein [Streptomyces yaizuensis]|uniref:Uncharacterized protein n=1 Tax=Streptomyces yaizuensis TaxID=2989713 RepID=A0ABQ5P7E9_9ACTN|nr:hypothetical protein [Streptomyces sp. YSPA8]GLF98151.1 hypothetical protein SYYSPA8_27660 [Streptomyces sp. YSPA8]